MSGPDPELPPSSRRVMHAAGADGAAAMRDDAGPVAQILRDDEIVILVARPSVLFIPLSCLLGLLLIAVLALGLALLALRIPAIPWSEQHAYLACFAAGGVRLGWQCLEWYCRLYVLTDQRVIRRRGVWRVSVFEMPVHSVEHTIVHARLRERLFGLGSIGFSSAGSDMFDVWWIMLRQPFRVHRIVNEAVQRYGR